VASWSGTITESDAGDFECVGGTASYSLDPSQTSQMSLTSDDNGGCSVSGTLHLVQTDGNLPICGQLSGPWTCTGDVDAAGNMTLDCECETTMTATGSFILRSAYSGTWDFSLDQIDGDDDSYTDTGTGNFQLNFVSAPP